MLQIKRSELRELAQNKLGDASIESQNKILVRISTSLAARTSYTTIGDEKELDYDKLIKLHDKLIEMKHQSPLEHVARAMSGDEYIRIFNKTDSNSIHSNNYYKAYGHCNNFKGFVQYRYMIDNNYGSMV